MSIDRLLASAGVALLAWVLLPALWSLPPESAGLGGAVRESLSRSGVSAEVTAVLLNFRGYDTLLELSVLLVVMMACWQTPAEPLPIKESGPVFHRFAGTIVPLTVLVAGYLVWLGGHAAGGAFQAGALLAGAGVLVLLVSPAQLPLRDGIALRAAACAGPIVLAAAAATGMGLNGSILQYPEPQAGAWIFAIEVPSAVSIGVILTVLFAGGPNR